MFFKVKTMKKNLLIILVVLLMLNTMFISSFATVENTRCELKVEEHFDTDCENLSGNASYSRWRTIKGLNAANADVEGANGEKVRVEDGKLIIPGGERVGAEFNIAATNYDFGFNNLNSGGRQKADEYVFEFDAKLKGNESIYFHDGGTAYLKLRNNLSLYLDKSSDDVYIDASNDEFHHYKIAVRTEYYDAAGTKLEYVRSTGKLYYENGDPAIVQSMYVKADVYVDGVCYAIDEVSSNLLTNPGVRQIKGFTAMTESEIGNIEIDNIEVYYLDGEKRTDATFTFKNAAGKTVFNADVASLNSDGNSLEVELRADGTQAEDEDASVFVVLFSADGVLKDVAIDSIGIAAGSIEKSSVSIEAPYFTDADIAADDYITVFVWESNEKIPYAAERTITAE